MSFISAPYNPDELPPVPPVYQTGNDPSSPSQGSSIEANSLEPIKIVRPRYAYAGNSDRGQRSTIKILNAAADELKNKYKQGSLVQSIDELTDDKFGGFQAFMLHNLQVSYTEKVQVMQTYGDNEVVYYFGRAPVYMQMSGTLFDDGGNNWFVRFCEAYTNLIRGTRSAQRGEVLQFNLPSCTVIGTITGFQYNQESSRDADIQFSMTVLCKKIQYKLVETGALNNYAGQLGNPLGSQELNNALNPTLGLEEINRIKTRAMPTDPMGSLKKLYGMSDADASQTASLLSVIDEYTEATPGIVRPVPSLGIPLPGINSGFGKTISDITASIQQGTSGITNFADSLSKRINGIGRTIQDFIGGAASVGSGLISSVLSPVNSILGLVQSITSTATQIVGAIENGLNEVLNPVDELFGNIEQTQRLLEGAEGVITHFPESMSMQISRFLRDGSLSSTSAILRSSTAEDEDVAAVLISRDPPQVADLGVL